MMIAVFGTQQNLTGAKFFYGSCVLEQNQDLLFETNTEDRKMHSSILFEWLDGGKLASKWVQRTVKVIIILKRKSTCLSLN